MDNDDKKFHYMVSDGSRALHRISDCLHLGSWGGGIFAFFYFSLHDKEIFAWYAAIYLALLWLATKNKWWLFGDIQKCRSVIESSECQVERNRWKKEIADWEKNPQNPKNKTINASR